MTMVAGRRLAPKEQSRQANSPTIPVALSILISMLAPLSAIAEDTIRFGEETFELKAGGFLQNFDTKIKVEDNNGGGANVPLEDVLGYDDNDVTVVFGGSWRFAERHRIEFSAFNSDRDVQAVATEDIDIGDGEIIPTGAGYKSTLKIQVIPLQYSYSFIKSDKNEFYGSVGMHWYSIDYDVVGAVGLGQESWKGKVRAEADTPMPLVGVGYDYYISDRWKVSVGAEAFYVKTSDAEFNFEGAFYSATVATEYYLFKHVGIGAAFSYFKVDVDIDDSNWNGGLDYYYWGPAAYVKIRF